MYCKTRVVRSGVLVSLGWLFVLCAPAVSKLLGYEPFVAGFDRFSHAEQTDLEVTGRLLLTELSCTACHAANTNLEPRRGPKLQAVTSRAAYTWLRAFLLDPAGVKPGTMMPDILHQLPETDRAVAADAILAFLSQGDPMEPTITASGTQPVTHDFWLKGDVTRGRNLYHQIGCIACHAVDSDHQAKQRVLTDLERKIESLGLDEDELKEIGIERPKPVRPVPIQHLAAKYSPRSLTMFLIEPHRIRPSSRMPSFKLSPHEASDLTAYLLKETSPEVRLDPLLSSSLTEPAPAVPSLIAKGEKLFVQLQCVNCHAMPDMKPVVGMPLDKLNLDATSKNCLLTENEGPRFGLGKRQVAGLRQVIQARRKSSIAGSSAADTLHFHLLQFNCYACHERGGQGGLGPDQWAFFENVPQVDIGDEGRIPPPLDHVGHKLKSAWLKNVLDGKGVVRPHFRARMPAYTLHSKDLAKALADADSISTGAAISNLPTPETSKSKDVLAAGRTLFDASCVQCHAVRGESLPGTVGIDLTDLGNRIEPTWFSNFLRNPAALKKNTRMPSLFPDGKSSIPHILHGDVSQQINALWSYLNAKDQPLPPKLLAAQSQFFELKPTDRPVVLRTFMDDDSAGTHAIAVGFPGGVNMAFDALGLRMAELWKGPFLNAQGTWFDRFSPPAVPLGDHRILLPKSVFGAQSSNSRPVPVRDDAKSFLGYRLDPLGNPTFLYRVRSLRLEDHLEVNQAAELIRRITWSAAGSSAPSDSGLWLTLAENIETVVSDRIVRTTDGLTIELDRSIPQHTEASGPNKAWAVHLPNPTGIVEIHYRW